MKSNLTENEGQMIIQSEPTPVPPTENRAKVFQLPWVS